ncbi:hypothetical protein [Erythrobacter sp. QSSC1-22B]|uniref:hypothetical protein n=1 Tax=Erythrobacter sp. QSSC1-22B TaxID=1860125 RepID=UPI00143C86AE|nr:hypothetical protein [Erythrobacter sp. QSSC1-22B]
MGDDDHVYDEETGEWMLTAKLVERKAAGDRVEVRETMNTAIRLPNASRYEFRNIPE